MEHTSHYDVPSLGDISTSNFQVQWAQSLVSALGRETKTNGKGREGLSELMQCTEICNEATAQNIMLEIFLCHYVQCKIVVGLL